MTHPSARAPKKGKRGSHRHPLTQVRGGVIHIVEAWQRLPSTPEGRTAEDTRPDTGSLPSHKQDGSRTQKAACCVTPLARTTQSRRTHGHRGQVGVAAAGAGVACARASLGRGLRRQRPSAPSKWYFMSGDFHLDEDETKQKTQWGRRKYERDLGTSRAPRGCPGLSLQPRRRVGADPREREWGEERACDLRDREEPVRPISAAGSKVPSVPSPESCSSE